VYYPAEEARTVPLSTEALRLIFYLYQALLTLFADRDDVYVGADQFIYWVRGDADQKLAPDGYVLFGVPKQPYRPVIRTWEEGATPRFVAEISSEDSRTDDRGRKLRIYRDVLRCDEYLIYDEPRKEVLFYRRQGGQFLLQQPDALGRQWSQALGCFFGADPRTLLRVYGPDGKPIEQFEELKDAAERLAGIAARLRQEVEELRARSEQDRNEAARLLMVERERARAERARAESAQMQLESEREQTRVERARAESARAQVDQEQARAKAEEAIAAAERERAEELQREVDRLRAAIEQQSGKHSA
jgi:Uma2 family endonuclease